MVGNTTYCSIYKRALRLPYPKVRGRSAKITKTANQKNPTGLRNKAMMSLMLHCGLRVSEVINLRPSNINLTKGKLRIESSKGNRDRELGIPEYIINLLEGWRKKRPESPYFFCTLKGKKLSVR